MDNIERLYNHLVEEEQMVQILGNWPGRIMRDRSNPFEEYDDKNFVKRFRFSKTTVNALLNIIGPQLQHKGSRGSPLSTAQQLFIALRFYATDSFHRVTGDLIGVHESTACRAVDSVTIAIASIAKRFISFPAQNELAEIAADFAQLSGDNFPGVMGVIDCTHIRISCPAREQAGTYINRKGFYSINVQVITDAKMKIRNIVARWPGSTHDSRIFRASGIKDTLEERIHAGHLLGDSGYGCKRYLLTPFLNPATNAQERYNKAHCRARNVIERAFGVWKKRFPCLLAFGLRTRVDRTLRIIVATAVLHNLAVERGEVPIIEDVEVQEEEMPQLIERENNVGGNIYRQRIVDVHFN